MKILTLHIPSTGELRNLQRIVLHQNNLRGPVPPALGELGCIVNLAGNPLLHHGDDVPTNERYATALEISKELHILTVLIFYFCN